MKKSLVITLVIVIFIIINVMYFSGIRYSAELALKAYEVNEYTVVGEYHIDGNESFIIYKNNFDEYGLVKIDSILGLHKVVNSNFGDVEDKGIRHIAVWLGGNYFDYIIVDDSDIEYVVAGDIASIKEFDGNLMSIYENRNRYRDEIIIKKVNDNTLCFWGKIEDYNKFNPGKITTFDIAGNRVNDSIIY